VSLFVKSSVAVFEAVSWEISNQIKSFISGNTAHKKQTEISHTRTVVRECCKGDEASQWTRPKFDPSPRQNPLIDIHQNWHTWFCSDRFRGFCYPSTWFCRATGWL